MPLAIDDNKLQHLNPVNPSEHVLSEDQTKLLRKGPPFCPAPQDINWQEVPRSEGLIISICNYWYI